jgi:thiosulfate/3-mercaptopyruvate sulfurtransferase
MYTTLIDSQTLSQHLNDADWVVVDCRFSLEDTEAGRRAYREGHIPGAVYAHLDEDLSGPPTTDEGRHPLPPPAALTSLFGRLGINQNKQVVAYDDANGMIAARLWWMLRYMGHRAVAVLDGGWQAWQEAGMATRGGVESNTRELFVGSPRLQWLVRVDDVPDVPLLVDARSPQRYRGEEEPLDPVAGHIPGAANYYYQQNWTEDGRYRSREEMWRRLRELVGDRPAHQVTFYCGSGVSACVNLLAMVHAGLGDGRLYVGSWSEWSRDRERPVAAG